MKTFLVALICVFLGLSVNNAQAEDAALSVTAQDAYSFATSPVQKNGAVFVEFTNTGDGDVKITSAKADVSESVELHTHIMDGDVMMMREVEGYDIPAGGRVTLQPMGHHIMLMGLKAPLVEGESFPITVMDANGAALRFHVMIKAPGAMKEHDMDKAMDHEGHGHRDGKDADDAAPEAPEAAH